MTYRLRNILIALALAVLAALLTTFYVANYKKHVQKEQVTVTVVVATKDIPVGLTGAEILKGHYLTTDSVAKNSAVPGVLIDPNRISTMVAMQPIYAGEQVTLRRFGAREATGVAGQITGVYRALQLAGDPNQLLVGTLQAGDHVDILANLKFRYSDVTARLLTNGAAGAAAASTADKERVATRIAMRDIEVLKVSGAGGGGKVNIGATAPGNWVMLSVTDNQAQKIYWLMRNADWWFALRPVIHAADSPNSVETIESVLTDGLKLNEFVQLFGGKAPTR